MFLFKRKINFVMDYMVHYPTAHVAAAQTEIHCRMQMQRAGYSGLTINFK